MKKVDLVVIPYNDFMKGRRFGFRSRDQHLFLELARDDRINKMFIIERPRSVLISLREVNLNLGKTKSSVDFLEDIKSKIFTFGYFSFGFEQVWLRHLWFDSVYSSSKFINKFYEAISRLEVTEILVVSFNPFANGFVKAIKPSIFVFDVMDNFYFHPEFLKYRTYMRESFEFISLNANLIFCVNDQVRKFFIENYPSSCKKIFTLPNGVDEGFKSDGIIPKDIRKIKRPRIGYAGVISDRLDFEVIEHIARKRKSYNFVFVGGKYGNVDRMLRKLRKIENIYFLGDKHYNELPRYVSSFDVCMIPHRIDEFTLSNDPMKIYEYLYLGKPVVSTRISISEDLVDAIFVSDNEEEFLRHLDTAVNLANDSKFAERQKKTIKEEMFWSKKASFIIDKIFEIL